MKAIIYYLLLATLVCFSASEAVAQSKVTDEKIQEFQDYLKEFRKENKIPSLSVAVVKDREIILLESIGFQDHDAEESTTV